MQCNNIVHDDERNERSGENRIARGINAYLHAAYRNSTRNRKTNRHTRPVGTYYTLMLRWLIGGKSVLTGTQQRI